MTNQLNCLRCRHCTLLPETDFAQRSPVIECQAINPLSGEATGKRILNLTGCPRAESARRNHGNVEMTPASIAFLNAWWPKASTSEKKDTVARLMGRSRIAVGRLASKYGARCPLSPEGRKAVSAKVRAKDPRTLTLAQCEYLRTSYAAGRWPSSILGSGGEGQRATREENRRIKRQLLEGMARRGPKRKWQSLVAWVYRQSPGYIRGNEERALRRLDSVKKRQMNQEADKAQGAASRGAMEQETGGLNARTL